MKSLYIQPYEQDYFLRKIAKKAIKKHLAIGFDDNFYESLKKEFFDEEFGETLKTAYTSGYCYFYALFLAKSMKGATLKNGVLNKLNATIQDEYYEPFIHSWVEFDGKVYDTTLKMIIDKEYYYKNYWATEDESYSQDELNNPEIFFKLCLNSIKDRYELIKPLKQAIKTDYENNVELFNRIYKEFNFEDYSTKREEFEKAFEIIK